MIKNKIHQAFILCLFLVGSLLLLSLVPEFSLGTWKFKRIDLLSEIKKSEVPMQDSILVAKQDSIEVKQDSIIQLVKEHCLPGITCLEDYSEDSTALQNFFEALINTKKIGKPLHVAFYGDSFIEGDVFCGSFRDTLQSIFGGKGVGYVPITSDVAGFRTTIKHSFENWKTNSLLSKKDSSIVLGPSGFCFTPKEGNWVEYRPSKHRFLRDFNTVKLYYTNAGNTALQYTINEDDSLTFGEALNKSSKLEEWVYRGEKIQSIRFEFFPFDSLKLYGASFEDDYGIYVDNFSMRGNSGMNLTSISDKMYREFNAYRNYRLIILQFGLNIIIENSLNYDAYTKRMIKVVNKLKQLFPQSSILLIGVSDRSSNVNGKYQTMTAIPALRNAQRTIAQETGIAFWDLFEAMGGENSMVKFTEGNPVLAAKDYTHLNFKGGKKVASSLVKSLMFEMKRYEK